MLLNCDVGEASWESPWLQGDPTSLSERKSILNFHWKNWCWSLNSNSLATWCEELTHWKRSWCLERFKVRGEGDNRGWDGWMASLPWWKRKTTRGNNFNSGFTSMWFKNNSAFVCYRWLSLKGLLSLKQSLNSQGKLILFSRMQHIPPGKHSRAPPLIASDMQTLKCSGQLLPSLRAQECPGNCTSNAWEAPADAYSIREPPLLLIKMSAQKA